MLVGENCHGEHKVGERDARVLREAPSNLLGVGGENRIF